MASKKPTSIEELKAWDDNPRSISRESLTGLRKSMNRFGDLSGITFNSKTGRLVTGHQRLSGLKADNPGLTFDKELQCLVTDGGEIFPVRTVDWDEDFELAANIAANHPVLQGVFINSVDEMIDQIELVMPDVWDELLLSQIKAEGEVEDLMEETSDEEKKTEATGHELPEMELLPFEHYDYIMILADNIHDWEWIANLFGLERQAYTLKNGTKLMGFARGIRASEAIKAIKGEANEQ
jgi:hypothetical protein